MKVRALTPDEAAARDWVGLPDGIEALGVDAHGRLAASALWIAREAERTGRGLLVRLVADDAAAGVALIAWAEERARQAGARTIQIGVLSAPGAAEHLAGRDYRVVESYVTMRRACGPRACPPLPPGHVERTLAEIGDAGYLAVANPAFEGVPGAFPLTLADFTRERSQPGFREDLISVVADAEGPVGFLRGALTPGHAGEVDAIGLVPRARGRGLGRWLLRRCEALLDAAGAPAVELLVAATNTAAVALYRRDGYVEIARRDSWERAL